MEGGCKNVKSLEKSQIKSRTAQQVTRSAEFLSAITHSAKSGVIQNPGPSGFLIYYLVNAIALESRGNGFYIPLNPAPVGAHENRFRPSDRLAALAALALHSCLILESAQNALWAFYSHTKTCRQACENCSLFLLTCLLYINAFTINALFIEIGFISLSSISTGECP